MDKFEAKRRLLASVGQLQVPPVVATSGLVQRARPVFPSRRAQLAEARKEGQRAPLAISVNKEMRLTIEGGNGPVPLYWSHNNKPIMHGELPAGTKVHIDPSTGATRLV